MQEHIAILNERGVLSLPDEIQQALGLHVGSRLAITLMGTSIMVEPQEELFSAEEMQQLIAEVDALAGSMPELRGAEEDLYEERKQW